MTSSSAPAEAPVWNVQLGWLRRGRTIRLQLRRGDDVTLQSFDIPLANLIREAGISRDEVEAAVEEASPRERGGEPEQDWFPEHHQMRVDCLPQDLSGKTVLDVGGYSGTFARMCLDRSASSATVYDSGEYTDYGWAKPLLEPGVEFQRGNLMDFGWRAPKPADVVIAYNLTYHIRDQWSAFERLRLLCKGTLCLCTSFVPGDEAAFKLFASDDPHEQPINGIYSVFWRPTISGLLKILRLTGFGDIETFGPVGDHVCVRARAI